MRYGSTDVGDVSWLVPTAQMGAVCWATRSPGHSWQNVAIGKSSIAHKGLLYAGKAMAATAIDLIEDPKLIEAAKAEFEAVTAKQGGYVCPIPADAVPTVI
jgi:aminobenzoyl-glutamate utilization protein B